MDLDVSTSEQSGHAVVTAAGEIDVYTAPSLDAALTTATDQGHRSIVVDLSAVEFLDSTGLAVLVKTLTRMRDDGGGSLAVVVTEERVAKVFRLTGLDSLIPMHATLDAALAG